ncbi:MAG: glycosyltransferase [Bacteroidetes bacterium]|nr:glycosyltransferase [Bacteroidota bacterium]
MKKRIFLAPLDWGLGHATRCIPLINSLLDCKMEVILGLSGSAGQLLQTEFSSLLSIPLPSYRVSYGGKGLPAGAIIRQIPSILGVIREEHRLLNEIIDQYQIDAVISDNRYGLWHQEIPCAIITHQLSVRLPWLHDLFGFMLRHFHYSFIRKFDACWIPDLPGQGNLSGALSHGIPLPSNTRYLGPLSRFASGHPIQTTNEQEETLLAILSGPEPGRSLLEEILRPVLLASGKKAVMVLGTPEKHRQPEVTGQLTIYPFLSSDELQKVITESTVIICRSGYSTIMDLAATGKKAILIPTPGQTEQEYLARYHYKAGNYYFEPEKVFNLERALSNYHNFNGLKISFHPDWIKEAIENLVG